MVAKEIGEGFKAIGESIKETVLSISHKSEKKQNDETIIDEVHSDPFVIVKQKDKSDLEPGESKVDPENITKFKTSKKPWT